jgi:glucose/arabinose dehydrogenase
LNIVRRFMTALGALALFMGVFLSPHSASAQTALSVPRGFRATVYASGLSNPTAMAFGPDGRLYVAQGDGVIRAIGKSGITTIAVGFSVALGLTWHNHVLYISSTGRITALIPSNKYQSFTRRVIVQGIPTGKHQNDSVVFSRGWMYVGVGSTCNACVESDARSASIMRFHLDGTHGQVYAHGLRNPYGLAIRPATGRLYATDNGRDDFGNSVPDELNLIQQGGRYGWPNCWGRNGGTNCAGTIAPVALFEPHSSADGLVFYTGTSFPATYRHDAFVAEWGDSINNLGTGQIVKRVHFQGSNAVVSTFATGFSHPLAVATGPGGALLVADYGMGIIWRIAWTG